MLNTLEEIKKRIEIINNLLPTFQTEERKEIKKNNKLIEELTKELTQYKDLIYNEMMIKKESSLPKENTKDIKNNQEIINKKLENINLLSSENYLSKLELNKNIYDIENSNNLEDINKILKEIIRKFKLINISLNKEDFKYSITLYKYMTKYLENIDKEDFNITMKEIFDSLYWENTELITHLSLCLRELTNKYKKQFDLYIKTSITDKDYNEEIEKYNSLKIDTDNLINTNKYLNYNLFFNKELLIDDYLEGSATKKENISKFISYEKYTNMTKEEKNNFYKEIRGLYHSVNEYIYLTKFSFLIDKIKEIYKSKDSYKTNLSTLEKTMKSLTNGKKKIDRKLFSIYNKLQHNDKNIRLNNKYNDLFNKSNNKINEIIASYREYDKTVFENNVITKLNDNSTYYDLLEIYSNNYPYLMTIIKENNKDISIYNDFIEYINNPYLIISKNIVFVNEIDIKEKLTEKYSLFSINFDLEESNINNLKQSLDYIYRLSFFEESNLNLNEIKLITEINKISKVDN